MGNQIATSSVAPDNSRSAPVGAPVRSPAPRWLVVAAWSLGPAGLYALASLGHAAVVERSLTVDVGFGRALAYWTGAAYLALLLWGFLPNRTAGWYARRGVVAAVGGVGLLGALVSGAYTALWLGAHWVGSVSGPVIGAVIALAGAATFTLWLAGREDRTAPVASAPEA